MKLGFQLLVCVIVLFTSFHAALCEKWSKALGNILNLRENIVRHPMNRALRDNRAIQKDFEDFALDPMIDLSRQYFHQTASRIAHFLDRGSASTDKEALSKYHVSQLDSFQKSTKPLFEELHSRMKNVDSVPWSLEGLCSKLKPYSKPNFTITAICSSFHQCATESYPYGRGDDLYSAKKACTTDQKCNPIKAQPMMASILYHAINNFIVQRLCPKESSNDTNNAAIAKLTYEIRLSVPYAFIMPPHFDIFSTNFIKDAVKSGGLSDLNVALKLVRDREYTFELVSFACDGIKFPEACVYGDIYKHYTLIEKVKKHRSDPGLVKDLRLNSKVKKQTMISLQRASLQHLEILGSIKKLDENLKVSVKGISSYFRELAKYDEGIAEQDIIFIKGELKKYEESLGNVTNELEEDFKSLGGLTIAVKVANFVEESAKLAVRIAENCNPLRVMFGGSEPGDIAEQAGKVANAASESLKAASLKVAADRLNSDSQIFKEAFFNGNESNKNQIKDIKSLVDKIREDQSENIAGDGADFLKQYGEYTPQIDRSSIAANNALWSAFKDAMCDLINGEVGLAGTIPQSTASSMLLCERLDGTLAQFFTLREDIFDFQFQMVDALARIVRGNTAKRLAVNIKGKGDVLDARELLLGFLMTHNRLQTHASLFCDILEYKNLGKPIEACSTVNGLFSKYNLDRLIAYQDTSPPSLIERDVFIPTKPRYQGDTGYIDLSALEKNGNVVFKIPANSSWLRHYEWSLYEENVPFVEDFKIYLPHKEYKTGRDQEHTTTRVTITSIGGNAVSTIAPNTSPVYILPLGHRIYVTIYEEGYWTCKSNYRIPNPYGLCNNLPDICDKSSRLTEEGLLLPTILSSWKLRFTIQQRGRKLKWKAPKPSTNLLIKATISLRMWPVEKRRSSLPRHLQRPKDAATGNGRCCDNGNKYWDKLGSPAKCKECPDRSTSILRGLYCEINQGDTSKERE